MKPKLLQRPSPYRYASGPAHTPKLSYLNLELTLETIDKPAPPPTHPTDKIRTRKLAASTTGVLLGLIVAALHAYRAQHHALTDLLLICSAIWGLATMITLPHLVKGG